MGSKTLPKSEHFELQPVAEGVYAAIAPHMGVAVGNAGIIDLGGRTVVFDTFETPAPAEDLRQAAEILTGRTVTLVVNSHGHPDHWFGNQVFTEAAIIATEATREHMPAFATSVQESKDDPSELLAYRDELQKRLKAETDPAQRQQLQRALKRLQHSFDIMDTLELRLPDVTFTGALHLHGTRRTVILETLGEGHTGGDAFLALPEERLVFLGDLGFFGRQPFMADCNPTAWLQHLAYFEASAYETFVPGHGPVSGKEALALQRAYIEMLVARVKAALEAGQPVAAVLGARMPAPFDAWSPNGMPLAINVEALFEKLGPQN